MKENVSKWTLWHLRWAAKQWLEEHPNSINSAAVRKAVITSFHAARLPAEPIAAQDERPAQS